MKRVKQRSSVLTSKLSKKLQAKYDGELDSDERAALEAFTKMSKTDNPKKASFIDRRDIQSSIKGKASTGGTPVSSDSEADKEEEEVEIPCESYLIYQRFLRKKLRSAGQQWQEKINSDLAVQVASELDSSSHERDPGSGVGAYRPTLSSQQKFSPIIPNPLTERSLVRILFKDCIYT